MFPYRGLCVLIALCAFGVIQASLIGHEEHHRFKHAAHHGPGHINATVNSTRPGNYSRPHYKWNLNRPIRSHKFNHHNSSFVGHGNATFIPAWNQTSHGHRPAIVPASYSNSLNNVAPKERGIFNIFNRHNSSSRVPAVNYRPPVYQPEYRPVYHPQVNSTWRRPSNGSRLYN